MMGCSIGNEKQNRPKHVDYVLEICILNSKHKFYILIGLKI